MNKEVTKKSYFLSKCGIIMLAYKFRKDGTISMKHILAIVGQIKKLIATVREENVASWKTIEKAAFQFVERKMYQDINDTEEERYRYYEITT